MHDETISDLAQTLSPVQEYRDAPNGGRLKTGNYGHDGSNAGAPKSRVKRKQGQNAEDFAELLADAIKKHKDGTAPLPVSQIIKGGESSAKIAYGEQVETILESETILAELVEVIGSFFQQNSLEPELALGLYEAISQRLRDR